MGNQMLHDDHFCLVLLFMLLILLSLIVAFMLLQQERLGSSAKNVATAHTCLRECFGATIQSIHDFRNCSCFLYSCVSFVKAVKYLLPFVLNIDLR